jgi:diguanylate cyclase (GGDEF)-like protein
MKKWVAAIAMVIGCPLAIWADAPATLTTLRAVHSLGNAQATKTLPVAFEATVTYYRGYERTLFVQDGGIAIYVQYPAEAKLVPGDRILVKGTTQPSFRPFVLGESLTLLHHGALPPALPATYDQLVRAQRDCLLVKVRGVVRAADLIVSSMIRSSKLQVVTDGGIVDVVVDSDDAGALKDLLDAEVEMTAVASGRFDGKMQQTGVVLHVSSLANIKVLSRGKASPWSLPILPMDEVLTTFHVKDLSQRVHVRGTITYYQPGSSVVLQDGAKSLWIETQTIAPLRVGDLAEATGFPDADSGFLTLNSGEIADSWVQAPIAPLPLVWRQLTTSKHIFDLVSIEGTIVTALRGASQDEYALISDGYMYSAIYRHPEIAGVVPLSPMKQIAVGSRVRVTGICVLDSANPFDRDVPFNILLRTSDDIVVLAPPPWLNTRNLTRVVSVLLLVIVSVAAWGWTLRVKVRRQTAALSARAAVEAALERAAAERERRRSRILEDINGTEPLAGILEQIAELTSFRLAGAPCWCEVTDGARLGQFPPSAPALQVISQEIPARSGPPLGKLFAAFPPESMPGPAETEALAAGAKLATLAIENRRMYADLVHRSEFDLLTDILNRFALDGQLDACIEEARRNARIFGLIYIDLDEFKQVNDLYGHHVGDLYLQEVSLRMKGQLRSHDSLARLGGDEFAALVPVVRSRAEVEEIAQRLERSFDAPYAVEGYVLHGSASVGIALYPQDGVTRDSLLNAADAAMYKAKHAKRQGASAVAALNAPAPALKSAP